MKNIKKIWLGCGLLVIALSFFLLHGFSRAYALTSSDFQQPPATYSLTGGTIAANLGGGVSVNFVNNNPAATPLVYTPSPATFNGGKFCSGSQITQTSNISTTAQIKVFWVNGSGACGSMPPTYSGTINISVAGVPSGSGGSATGQSCESNFDSPLAWIICPALSLADSAAGAFNSFVEDQLCFKTTSQSTSSTGSDIVCNGNNNLDSSVHNAWSIFKNIASALLVIVMLVMVFSQAIGGGPVDAYTVRKMLPKLVAAVVIMQLSWILLKFAIDLSNDIGKSIAAVIEAPFGGINNLTLKHMVGVDLSSHGTATNNVVFFSALAAGAVAGGLAVSIPGLALLALYVVIALLTAFVVLLLRKLLIILLVILAPLALVLWILPGTERYWKMWWDNFIKLVAMFPLIMAIIAGGRIFADITAGNSNGSSAVMFNIHLAVMHLGSIPIPYIASFSSFADLAIIIGAFFGPYFFLPQTFKWGGAAMGAISQGVKQGMDKGFKPAKDYLNWRKDLSPPKLAREARKAEVSRRRHTKFYENLGTSGIRGRYRKARLGGPEALIPGLRGRDRELRQAIARGGVQKAEEEERAAATLKLKEEASHSHPGDEETYYKHIFKTSKNNSERYAALDLIADIGGEKNLDFILQEGQEIMSPSNTNENEKAAFANFSSRKAQQLFPKLPNLPTYKGTIAAAEGLKPQDFSTLSASGMRDMIEDLEGIVANTTLDATTRSRAQDGLNNISQAYAEAIRAPSVAPNISYDLRGAVMGHASTASPEPAQTGPLSPDQMADAVARGVAQGQSQQNPGTTFRPTSGASTGGFQGETYIPHDDQPPNA